MIRTQCRQALGGRERMTLEAEVTLRAFPYTDPMAISYLFGCGGEARAAVVDPVSDVGGYFAFRVSDEDSFVASMLANWLPVSDGLLD